MEQIHLPRNSSKWRVSINVINNSSVHKLYEISSRLAGKLLTSEVFSAQWKVSHFLK
jgi:hypothetical protein